LEITLKKISLFRLLLDLCGEPHWKIAKAIGLTACNLSRAANGVTWRRSSLEAAAAYLSQRLNVTLDYALLTEQLGAKELVAGAHWVIENRKAAA
jgi:hypothetical protein